MKASVLISSFNYADYLPEAITSALEQSYPVHEIVVVDDGSTDKTDSHVRPQFESRKRIKWIRQENSGQLASIQSAVRNCTGDVCFFLDADDYYESDYIELMIDYYSAHPKADFVFSEPFKFSGDKSQPPKVSQPKTYDYGISLVREIATQRFIGRPTSALTAKTKLLHRLFPFPEDILKQWTVSADDCLIHGASLCCANKHFYGIQRVNYRIHEKNQYQSLTRDPASEHVSRIKSLAFINYMKDRLCIDDNHLGLALRELQTLPNPSKKDVKLYTRIYKLYNRHIRKDRRRYLL